MTHSDPTYATLDEWIAREAIPCDLAAPTTFDAALDQVIASLDDSVELLGFGETLHFGEDILLFRNRLFQRLVEAHGYSAIAIESSFPRSPIVNEYIAGRGPATYAAVQDAGFSHNFGQLEANRELVEWMRQYNADPTHRVKLHFYGFDSPTEGINTDSPRHILHFVLDYLTSVDEASGQAHRQRVDELLGQDAAWENPAAIMDPTQAIGLSSEASALRVATEELIAELHMRRPEMVAKSDQARYLEAMQFAAEARQLLNYHAELARQSTQRFARASGLRAAIMAENMAYIVSRERAQGKVLVFAHNSHLQRAQAQWQLGPDLQVWWPAGAHFHAMFGRRYAVIGSALGESPANGIGQPEPGTLEARLLAQPGPVRFIPTHRSQGLPASAIAELPVRTGSMKNQSYFVLTSQSLTDFDWLATFDATTYSRGGSWLGIADANAEA